MKVSLKNVVKINCTPKFLRDMADDMEKIWLNTKWGDSLIAGAFEDELVRIEFVIDQRKMDSLIKDEAIRG